MGSTLGHRVPQALRCVALVELITLTLSPTMFVFHPCDNEADCDAHEIMHSLRLDASMYRFTCERKSP